MVQKATFDECFQTFPRLRSPSNLTDFWQAALLSLKKISVEPQTKIILKKSLGRETLMEVRFRSFDKRQLRGLLSIPRKRGKIPAVISFHDYHKRPELEAQLTLSGIAQLALELRDHEELINSRKKSKEKDYIPPSFFHKYGISTPDESYPYACFLDAVRCVDFMRLQKSIDYNRIALLGRGFGASLAIFVASQRKEVKAIALEGSGLTWIDGFLQESEAKYAVEIRKMLKDATKSRRTKLRRNLDYLDVLNWAEVIKQPLLMTVALKESFNTPRSAFAFFNHILTEKEMNLFPEEMNKGDKISRRKKSVNFLIDFLSSGGK